MRYGWAEALSRTGQFYSAIIGQFYPGVDTGSSIPNQLKKPTQKPTLKWVFFLFNGVADVKVEIMGAVHRKMMHLTDVLKLILRLMGPECEKYYAEDC